MMKGVAAAVSLALLASGAQAQSPKEKYELSERCSKRAAETFEKEWGTGFHNAEFGNYESHYNAGLNKCFYLLTKSVATALLLALANGPIQVIVGCKRSSAKANRNFELW